jgi:polyphosphate glucokinase
MTSSLLLGIDFGGSGIKGAPVDLAKGVLTTDRFRIETPNPSNPVACAGVIAQIAENFKGAVGTTSPIGITYPGVVRAGTTLTAANVDKDWIGFGADGYLEEQLKRPVTVLNDAQAAVLAEVRHGAGKGSTGLVLMLTFGTGIGSGLAFNGAALPGIELGHLRMNGLDAEKRASASVKDTEKLSWKAWSERVNEYLDRIEQMLWPELIIVGGGVSEKGEKFIPRLKTRAPIIAATLGNGAGIVGAAIAASEATYASRIGTSRSSRPSTRAARATGTAAASAGKKTAAKKTAAKKTVAEKKTAAGNVTAARKPAPAKKKTGPATKKSPAKRSR